MVAQNSSYPFNTAPEIQITYSINVAHKDRLLINTSRIVADFLRSIWNPDLIEFQEYFCALYLSRSNHLIGYRFVSKGGVAGTLVDIKHILAVGLKANASAIVLSHNHPSGNLEPSHMDIRLTNRLMKAANQMDMQIWDHIILTKQGYSSFADRGLLGASGAKIVSL